MTTVPKATANKAPSTTAVKTAAQKMGPPRAASKALAKAVPPPKPVAQAVAKVAPEPQAGSKPKKPKLMRDSFTIPKNEYEAIATLKDRALKQGVSVKKSELLRAGLMTLAFMSDAAFAKALAEVPTLKTGRPAAPAVDKKAK